MKAVHRTMLLSTPIVLAIIMHVASVNAQATGSENETTANNRTDDGLGMSDVQAMQGMKGMQGDQDTGGEGGMTGMTIK